jgi:hypothetical protein
MLQTAIRKSTAALLVLGACATPIPDSAKIATDSGGLSVPTGLCDDRAAGVGAAPVERVELELNCAAPDEEGLLRSCSEATLSIRDALGGLVHLSGLSQLEIALTLPATQGGRTFLRVVPLAEEGFLSDGLLPELGINVPTSVSSSSLQVLPEDQSQTCTRQNNCAYLGLAAIQVQGGQDVPQYPLGTAASGVFLMTGIGWAEEPVILELEVPFFAPESAEATICGDGLIHYVRED